MRLKCYKLFIFLRIKPWLLLESKKLVFSILRLRLAQTKLNIISTITANTSSSGTPSKAGTKTLLDMDYKIPTPYEIVTYAKKGN